MKTSLAFIVVLMLAAISASALAMPCGQRSRLGEEVRDSQQIRLHVAQQQVVQDQPAPFKVPGQIRTPV
jgi:hypothetical protein